ncbi:MAG: cyclodeaminase/cyclohydrolase family protein [Oscillospiraceae bacterium]|nr:cyclodeaminase/cyclohydrolase family protein [Oscillospiraceae bacterium]
MDLLNASVTEFTAQLASPAPVPGGGGASALVAAIGVALGDMVGELTVGKKKYADVEEDIKALMARAQELRVQLLACIEKDAVAFEPLSRAYGIPKDDPTRDAVMETCLRDAAAAPLEIFDLCCDCIELQRAFAEKGSKLVLSDAATGVAFCLSALYGAAVNVKVNTKLMKDRAYAEQINAHVDEAMAKYRPMAEQVYEDVYRRFCG